MAYLPQLNFPIPISSYTIPKTPIPIFSFHYTLPFSTSILSSLPRRSLSLSIPQFSATEFSATTGDDDDELLPDELDNEVDYSDEDDDVDVVALEQEAKEVALEYSSSLSRVLTIGEFFISYLHSQFVEFFVFCFYFLSLHFEVFNNQFSVFDDFRRREK
jgi:hypothetical protein